MKIYESYNEALSEGGNWWSRYIIHVKIVLIDGNFCLKTKNDNEVPLILTIKEEEKFKDILRLGYCYIIEFYDYEISKIIYCTTTKEIIDYDRSL